MSAQGAVDALISVCVLEEQCRGQGDVDGAGGRDVGELALELLAHLVEAGRQRRFFVLVANVEGRSSKEQKQLDAIPLLHHDGQPPGDLVFLPYLYLLSVLCNPERMRVKIAKSAREKK